MKLSFLTFILLLCNYAAATVSLQYSQRRCGLLLTIKQAQIFNDFLKQLAEEEGNLPGRRSKEFQSFYSEAQKLRDLLPSYDSRKGSYFFYNSTGLKFLAHFKPYQPRYTEYLEDFSLEYNPAKVGRFSILFQIFGSEPLLFNKSHVEFAIPVDSLILPGDIPSIGLRWKTKTGQDKKAIILISRDSGQIFIYPKWPGEEKSFRKTLTNEIRNLGDQRSGEWISEVAVSDVTWIAQDEITHTPLPTD